MVDAAELPCKKTRSNEPWQVVTPVTDWGRMIRGSPTLAKVLVGLFCAQHIHVLYPFGACAQKRSRRFFHVEETCLWTSWKNPWKPGAKSFPRSSFMSVAWAAPSAPLPVCTTTARGRGFTTA